MHMLSQKDLDSSELETVRVSRTSVAVITANGGVHTKEEATAYVKALELCVHSLLLPTDEVLLFCRLTESPPATARLTGPSLNTRPLDFGVC